MDLRHAACVLAVGTLCTFSPPARSGAGPFVPEPDARIVFVSPSGSDGNDGLSANKPLKSVAKGIGLLREGSSDLLLLERGSKYEILSDVEIPDGRDAGRPVTIAAYGEGADPWLWVGPAAGEFEPEEMAREHLRVRDVQLFGVGSTVVNNPFLGINLNQVTYYTPEWAFADVMKMGMEAWLSQKKNDWTWDYADDPIPTDANGWPRPRPDQVAAMLFLRSIEGQYPAGIYTCRYEGTAKISFSYDAKQVVSSEPGEIRFRVEPSNSGILMKIQDVDPSDPVRNIRIWMPGTEGGASDFHPKFVEALRPFGVIRFMDWQRTNSSTVTGWSDRTRPTHFTQSRKQGVAIEHMVDLCNETGADAWFCMPHLADDDYVRRFAELVRDRLHPDRKVYVEYSNEVWNSQFQQSQWAQAQAQAAGINHPRFTGRQAKRDFDIWAEVFADQADRLVRVAAGQQVSSWVVDEMTKEMGAGSFDAVSCAAYFTSDETSLDALFAHLEDKIATYYAPALVKHGAIADRFTQQTGKDVLFVAYEGGQHLSVGGRNNDPREPVYAAAQNDPRMYDLYLQNLRAFEQAGGDVFLAYSFVTPWNKWGYWGHLQRQDQPAAESQKMRAMLDYVSGRGRFESGSPE